MSWLTRQSNEGQVVQIWFWKGVDEEGPPYSQQSSSSNELQPSYYLWRLRWTAKAHRNESETIHHSCRSFRSQLLPMYWSLQLCYKTHSDDLEDHRMTGLLQLEQQGYHHELIHCTETWWSRCYIRWKYTRETTVRNLQDTTSESGKAYKYLLVI